MFDAILFTLWDALLATVQALVLNAAPGVPPLSHRQTRLLKSALVALLARLEVEIEAHARSHLPKHLTTASAFLRLLMSLALAPTERLQAEFSVRLPFLGETATGAPPRQAAGGGGSKGGSKGGGKGGLALIHIVQLLRQRPDDALARSVLADGRDKLAARKVQVLFSSLFIPPLLHVLPASSCLPLYGHAMPSRAVPVDATHRT